MDKQTNLMKSRKRNAYELLPHKLFPPPNYDGAILRRRLIDDIFERPKGVRGVIFQAPAGFGKTTSLQQVMEAFKTRGWNVGWLSCDEGDNDPRRFLLHLEALIAQNNLFDEVPRASDGSLNRFSEWIIDKFLNNRAPIALFFDELQTINDESVKNFFRFILPRLPSHVLIFMGTRTQPDIGLATLLAHHVVMLFQSSYLKFSAEEVQNFFMQAHNLEITDAEVAMINEQTEGWPAALQLFRLALANPEVRSSLTRINMNAPRTLTEYLADNVLSSQEKNIQEFLIKTSVLRRMSGELCELITEMEGSQKILERIERGGLFITPMDIDGVWYKYHSLFSSFLKGILERDYRSEISKIHEQAAHWFYENGIYEEALHHALAAEKNSFATEILNEWGSDLIISSNLVTMERWCDRISFDQMKLRMDLAIKSAYVLLFLRRRDHVSQLLSFIEDSPSEIRDSRNKTIRPNLLVAMSKLFDDDILGAMEILGQPGVFNDSIPEGFAAFELAAAANLFAFGKIAQADYEGARISLLLAKNCSNRIQSSFSNGYTLALEALSLIIQGKMKEATSIFGSLDSLFSTQSPEFRMRMPAALAACQIWALYEANQIAAACALWSRYEDEITSGLVPDFMAVGHIFASRAFYLKGDLDKATSILASLERIAHSSQWTRIVNVVNLERIRHSLLAKQFTSAKAKSLLERIKTPFFGRDFMPLSEYLCGNAYISIRLLMQSGDLVAAKKAVTQELVKLDDRPYLRLKMLLLNALIDHFRNNPRESMRILSQALECAYVGGYERTLLDKGAELAGMIRQIYDTISVSADDTSLVTNSYKAFLRKILFGFGIQLGDTPEFEVNSVKRGNYNFSKRQIEILRLLVEGKSNKEIASCMFISENTVKFHLKNIFGDLEVSSRSQAIKVMREQNLFH